jgi:legume-like lectin family protein
MRTRNLILALFLAVPAAPAPADDHPAEKYSWSFLNFDGDPCVPGLDFYSWDLYRQTFIGIPSAPESNFGFDYLLYKEAYEKQIGGPGSCYGMVLLSLLINDKGGHLGYCGPVGQYSGDLIGTTAHTCKGGGIKFQGPTDPMLRRAIWEMHGHQLNLAAVRYYLEQIAKGQLSNGALAYNMVAANKPCIVSLIKDKNDIFGAGHTILGYDAQVVNGQKRIFVVDPNRTWALDDADNRSWYTNDDNYIWLDPGNDWHFEMAGGASWTSPTGLIAVTPLSISGPRDRNPGSLGFGVAEIVNQVAFTGDAVSLVQVTDSTGKVLFHPGTRDFETDPQAGVLNIAPIAATGDGDGSGAGGERYVIFGQRGGSLDFDVRAGTDGYQMVLSSRLGTLKVTAHGGRGTDRVRIHDAGTSSARIGLYNLAGASDYELELSRELRGGQRERSYRLHRVSLPIASLLEVGLAPNDQGLEVVSPTGSASFDLELSQRDPGAAKSASLPGVAIGPGRTGRFAPADWSALKDGEVQGAVDDLPVSVLEAYCDTLQGPGRGPVGDDFQNSREVGGASGGSTRYDSRALVYTQTSSGTGIGNGGDSFQYAYQAVSGDFEFTVEVVDRSVGAATAPPTALAGLMARRDCSPASKESFLATPALSSGSEWPRWNYRRIHGDNQSTDDRLRFNYQPDQAPRFLKLVRRGSTFTGFLSLDGVDFRPVGSDTWYGEAPGSEVLVGFASTTGPAGIPATTRFKVHALGAIDPALDLPLPDSGGASGEVIYQNDFAGRPGSPPEQMTANHRDGAFTPQIRNGRLRLTDESIPDSSTSAFAARVLDGVDQAIFQFDFDLFLSRAAGEDPGEGVTFAVTGGGDLTRVGFRGEALGYEGLGRQVTTDQNVSRNGFAVEFDQVKDAPRSLHVGIDAMNNVNTIVDAAGGLPDPFAPAGLHATVVYNRGLVTVYLSQNGAAGSPVKALEASVLPVSFASAEEGAVFGFTAATGAASETAEVDNLVATRIGCNDAPEVAEVDGVPPGAAPLGGLVTLDGSASSAGAGEEGAVNYLWSVVSGGAAIVGPNDGPTVNLRAAAEGPVVVKLTVDDGVCDNPASKLVTFTVGGRGNWIRCDSNGDRARDISDPVFTLAWLFQGGPDLSCMPAGDCQGDGVVDISDAVFDLAFQFLGGPPPQPPYPDCDSFTACGDACP